MPAPCAGAVAWIWSAAITEKLVAGTSPNDTAVAPRKPLPEIVTDVPPSRAPEAGLRPLTTGGATYVNSSAGEIADVPPTVVTVTSTVPAPCAGAVALIWLSLTTVNEIAAALPNDTAVALVKPLP